MKKKIKDLNVQVKQFKDKKKDLKSVREKKTQGKELFDDILPKISKFSKNEVFQFINDVQKCRLIRLYRIVYSEVRKIKKKLQRISKIRR